MEIIAVTPLLLKHGVQDNSGITKREVADFRIMHIAELVVYAVLLVSRSGGITRCYKIDSGVPDVI